MANRLALLALPIVACGDNLPRLDAVLTSEHFEVRVHSGATAPDGMLDRLEEHYRTTRAFLKFSETKVIYSLFGTLSNVQAACGFTPTESVACSSANGVFTTNSLDAHELIHAYMFELGLPAPLLREGIAQGVQCVPAGLPVTVDVAPWQVAAAQSPLGHTDIYNAAFFLFVYLAERSGIDRFVDYYARAHDTLDPDLFRRDFESFWGVPLDTAWQEMLQPRAGVMTTTIVPLKSPICPCTQMPALPVDGARVEVSAPPDLPADNSFGNPAPADRILPLPDGDPGPYLVFSRGSTLMWSCAQDRGFDLRGYELDSSKAGLVTVARLAPEQHYVAVTGFDAAVLSVTKAQFLASTCDAAEAITLPADASGEVQVRIAADTMTPSAGDWYWRVAIADRSQVTISPPANGATQLTVCPSCDQSAAGCVNIPATGGKVTLQAMSPELVFHVLTPPDAYSLALRVTLVPTALAP